MLVRAFSISAVLAATVAASAAPVRVSADRRHIVVCDNKADNMYVETEYATSILGMHTVADTNGADWGCGEQSTLFSHIDVIKMCTGIRGVTRRCERPVRRVRRQPVAGAICKHVL